MLVYKILSRSEWAALEADGSVSGSDADRADGFVHLSTAGQVAETAAKHFAGRDNLMLLALESEGSDALRWEPSRGGALFPHLYAPLRREDVLWAVPLPLGSEGRHRFPQDLA